MPDYRRLAMTPKDKCVMFLATGAFVGRIPFIPGTIGSLWGLPVCFLLSQVATLDAIIALALLISGATWIAHQAGKLIGKRDPRCIVIDEVAGMAVTLIGLPCNAITVIAGFAIFRALDILKPFPIGNIDRSLSGGIGIVADDVAAGLFGNLAVRAVLAITGVSG